MKEECSKGSGPKKVVSDVSGWCSGNFWFLWDSSKWATSCKIETVIEDVRSTKIMLQPQWWASNCDAQGTYGEHVIRDVKCLRKPAVIVATERQLNDLVRFCTVPGNFSILIIDPTFCLGDFDVTLITYRHQMLTSKQGNQHPAIIGPVMIHYKKTFSTYLLLHPCMVFGLCQVFWYRWGTTLSGCLPTRISK